jgi:hypothetical protein
MSKEYNEPPYVTKLIDIALSEEQLDITTAFDILDRLSVFFPSEPKFDNDLQEQLLVKIKNVIQATPYNNTVIQKYFGYNVPYEYSILKGLKRIGCRKDTNAEDCKNRQTYIDILNTLNEIIFNNINDSDFVHLIPVADYDFIPEPKPEPISTINFAFIYHIDIIAETYIKLSFLLIQDGQQVIDMGYKPDRSKTHSYSSYHMPFDQPFTIKINGDDITEFPSTTDDNSRHNRLLTKCICQVSNKTYPVGIFYLSRKYPKHLAIWLLDKTFYVPISLVSFTFPKEHIGSRIRRTIRILGRERKIHKQGRKSYIIFQKQYMSLADARTLEKKRANEKKQLKIQH